MNKETKFGLTIVTTDPLKDWYYEEHSDVLFDEHPDEYYDEENWHEYNKSIMPKFFCWLGRVIFGNK